MIQSFHEFVCVLCYVQIPLTLSFQLLHHGPSTLLSHTREPVFVGYRTRKPTLRVLSRSINIVLLDQSKGPSVQTRRNAHDWRSMQAGKVSLTLINEIVSTFSTLHSEFIHMASTQLSNLLSLTVLITPNMLLEFKFAVLTKPGWFNTDLQTGASVRNQCCATSNTIINAPDQQPRMSSPISTPFKVPRE